MYLHVHRSNLCRSLHFGKHTPFVTHTSVLTETISIGPGQFLLLFPARRPLLPGSHRSALSPHKVVLPITELHIDVFGSVASSSRECFPGSSTLFHVSL